MSQAVVNIGTMGHVDHGKTTLVQSLTGKWTDTHSEEVKRGITIKLGYADATVRKCPQCKEPDKYTTKTECVYCKSRTEEVRKISFVDAPGHETLMATVIAASSIMDGALFTIAANEKCPMPQTNEHLAVLEASGIKHAVIVQTKIDLVTKEKALEHYKEIREFLKGTRFEDAPVIPTAVHAPQSLHALLQAIEETIPTPQRPTTETPRMLVARSFDVNKPGTDVKKLVGGVVGGSIVSGMLKVGEKIEIVPGVLKKRKEREEYERLLTTIVSLNAGSEDLKEARPGGLVGVATSLDPALTHADALVGNLLGPVNTLPPVLNEVQIEISPLKRVLEVFNTGPGINEPLVLGIGTNTTVGFITEKKKKKSFLLKLKKPVCANAGEQMAVMRRANNRWRLYGTAKIL